jgi:hypothetical protein
MSSLGYSTYGNKQNKHTRKHKHFNHLKKTLHTAEDSDSDDDDFLQPHTHKNKYMHSANQHKLVESMQGSGTDLSTTNSDKSMNLSNSVNETNEVNEANWAHSFNHTNIFNKKEQDNTQINHLLEKMNNIILLLEENYDEKKGSVIEEVILYCFLGIFIIYLVDSFVKVGKYVR